jgi:DNA-binding response OmpR family regulator
MPNEILLIDDDPLLRRSLAYSLEHACYRVRTAKDAGEGLGLARTDAPDLVLLDIGLPGMDGLDALRIFQHELKLPVILLTARRGGQDEALGLELGADDYVTKPYNMDALLARIAAVLRRAACRPTAAPSHAMIVGELVVDPRARTAAICGQELRLSPRVFALLTVLASHAGEVVPLDALITQVWGREFSGEPQALYVHIRWLREKLATVEGHSVRIVTVHRVGYKLVAEDA